MSTRIAGSLLLVIALVISYNAVAYTQDPQPQQTTPATQSTQMDLSGTYTGTFNCESLGLMGDTTLTITGNQFTTADGKTGRIVASKSRGYTAIALQMGEMTPATTTGPAAAPGAMTTAPHIISLRGRKSGDRLTLTSVPGAMQKCTFTPMRANARGRRNQQTPSATGTTVAMPEAEQTPSPSPSPTPEPSPEPNPSPGPSPMPSPMPSPSGSPTPMPSPTGSPTPSPTPSPIPGRG